MYPVNVIDSGLVQLGGHATSKENIRTYVQGSQTMHAYDRGRFDPPLTQGSPSIDRQPLPHHHVLMLDCWGSNLYSALKAAEQMLRVPRRLQRVMSGGTVVGWCERKRRHAGRIHLGLLLRYNDKDVMKLKPFEEDLRNSGNLERRPHEFEQLHKKAGIAHDEPNGV